MSIQSWGEDAARWRGSRFALAAALLFAAAAATASTESERVPVPLALEWCLDRGLAMNPDLEITRERLAVAVQRARGSGTLDDPRIGYQAVNIPTESWSFDASPMSGHQLELSQSLPFPGLLSSRRNAARSRAEAASANLDQERLGIASELEIAWSQLAYAQRAIEIIDRNLAVLRQMSEFTEARYRVGKGPQQDVLRAQLQVSRLLEVRLRHEQVLRQNEAGLTALLALPASTALPRTRDPAEASPIPELEPLLAGVSKSSPALAMHRARIQAAERDSRAAQLEAYPDFGIGLKYRIREAVPGDPVEGEDFLSAGFSLRLPIQRRRWNARQAEAEAELRLAKAELRATEVELGRRIASAHSALQAADSEASLLATGLLAQARRSRESSRSGYEVGRIDFLGLLDSEVQLFDVEMRLLDATTRRRMGFARLEAAFGEKLR